MPQRPTSPISRKLLCPLRVEALEDRRLLTGLAVLQNLQPLPVLQALVSAVDAHGPAVVVQPEQADPASQGPSPKTKTSHDADAQGSGDLSHLLSSVVTEVVGLVESHGNHGPKTDHTRPPDAASGDSEGHATPPGHSGDPHPNAHDRGHQDDDGSVSPVLSVTVGRTATDHSQSSSESLTDQDAHPISLPLTTAERPPSGAKEADAPDPVGPELSPGELLSRASALAEAAHSVAAMAMVRWMPALDDEYQNEEAEGHLVRSRGDRAEFTLTAVATTDDALAVASSNSAERTAGAALTASVLVHPERQAAGLYLTFAMPPEGLDRYWDVVGRAAETSPTAAALPEVRLAFAGAEPDTHPQALPPAPAQSAGLAEGTLPADTASLQEAIHQFLHQLDGAGRELTRVLTEHPWLRWALAAGLVAVAAEAGRRRVRRAVRRGETSDGEDGTTLSWLSGSYPFASSSF